MFRLLIVSDYPYMNINFQWLGQRKWQASFWNIYIYLAIQYYTAMPYNARCDNHISVNLLHNEVLPI